MFALNSAQTDRVIELAGKLIDHVPALLGILTSALSLFATVVLLVRQHFNKRDLARKIDTNTELTHEVKKEAAAAYNEANNVNLKLASLGIQTKPGENAEGGTRNAE